MDKLFGIPNYANIETSLHCYVNLTCVYIT